MHLNSLVFNRNRSEISENMHIVSKLPATFYDQFMFMGLRGVVLAKCFRSLFSICQTSLLKSMESEFLIICTSTNCQWSTP